MNVEQLKRAVEDGSIDTVLLVFTDMQGRLQGKRLVGKHFVEEVLEHARRPATTCWPSTST